MKVSLNAQKTMVLKTAAKTPDLLSHEQGHFNLMILSARALARAVEALETDTVPELAEQLEAAKETHGERAKAIDEAYDTETENSRKPDGQKKWDDAIKAAMTNPKTTKINGMLL